MITYVTCQFLPKILNESRSVDRIFGSSFPGVERPGRGFDHPPLSTAKVKEMLALYIYSPVCVSPASYRMKFTLQGLRMHPVWITFNQHSRNAVITLLFILEVDGFGGLVVSILATGTRVRGFKPGWSRWIFRASGKSSVWLPSEGK